jgi:molecular chaperone GrpE
MSKKPTITELQQQITDLTDALQRERADVINVRRRHEEQISSLKTLVKANVVRDLLPVIDNFERALRHSPAESGKQKAESEDKKLDDWIKGVMSIKAQFDKTLESMGVERIKTVGEVFDPRLHEAVSMEEGDGMVEVICEELQPGYALGDDIIRHAMVKVKMEQKK